MDPDLATSYLGMDLRTPLVASAGPHTGELVSLLRLQDAGISAVVLPSVFEEELTHESLELDRMLEHGAESFGEALSYFPEMPDYGVGPDKHLRLVEQAKSRLEVPVIASLNADSPGGWTSYAQMLQEAGADAIELNIYAVAADPGRPAAEVEASYLEMIAEVSGSLRVPVAVKISPFLSSLSNFAARAAEAGADGLVLFNRLYQPDLDLETLEVVPRLELSHPWELRLPLRWLAILRPQLQISLAATTGVGDAEAALKALLVGADAVMMTSALLRHGPGLVTRIEQDMKRWITEHNYDSVAQLKGSVSHAGAPDPAAFERAQYLRTLASWRPGTIPANPL